MGVVSTVPPVQGPAEWIRIVSLYHIKPLDDTGYLASAIYLTIIGVISTVGNSLVLAIFLRDKHLLKKPQNLLLVNLAISDIGISVFGYPWTVASNYAKRYLFGTAFCSIQGFMTFTLAQTDMNTLACLSVFRYITICYPQFAYCLNYEVAKFTIIFTWAYSLLWTTPPLVGWSSYTFEPFGTSCSIDWSNSGTKELSYTWCLIIFCFLIHVVVMIYCYCNVCKKIREVDGRVPPSTISNPRTGEIMRTYNMRKEKRVTLIALLLNVTFVVIWAPYTVVCLWSVYDKDLPSWVTTFPTFFAKASCMTNPFLYFLTNSTLRLKAKRLFTRNVQRVYPYPPRPSQPETGISKDGVYIGRRAFISEKMETSIM
ncbi:visual pigment-like receptor peropsin [Haliotis rufescens]|uniref:visual pigment-like receptor peropsin n=1 Tax=Haliotis rufescens TaxID=6454 RepID=UPI00201F76BD|nr:visual pigment-like receptor peropsin [Haliotis rufescens]